MQNRKAWHTALRCELVVLYLVVLAGFCQMGYWSAKVKQEPPVEPLAVTTTAATTTAKPVTTKATTRATTKATTRATTTAKPATTAATTAATTTAAPEPAYTEEDLETLALIIYQEAGADYCSDETRLMVGNVVLNRVADDRFPDTIVEVATAKRQYGRLYWTGLVWPERASRDTEAHAVARAYDIAERLLDGERVLPEDVIWQAEFEQGTEVVAHQDGIYFCR